MLKVFTRMSDAEVNLPEYEGSAFLPYLVIKVGDPKDNIRRDIRAIFKVVVNIYPSPKFYTYLMGGLKSKVNKARQGKILLYLLNSGLKRIGLILCKWALYSKTMFMCVILLKNIICQFILR